MTDTFDCPQCGDRFLVNESQIRHCPGCAHPVAGAMAWTSGPPTEPGWYWWLPGPGGKAEVVHAVEAHGLLILWRAGNYTFLHPAKDGQWSGPLVPPQ